MFPLGRTLRIGMLALAPTLVATGCDDPTGPGPTDFVGEWNYAITDATGDGVVCDVEAIRLTFERDEDGVLGGRVVAAGGNNLTCTYQGAEDSQDLTGNTPLGDVMEDGTSVSFTFSALAGPWISTGIISDHRITGTARIHVRVGGDVFELNGSWSATRR